MFNICLFLHRTYLFLNLLSFKHGNLDISRVNSFSNNLFSTISRNIDENSMTSRVVNATIKSQTYCNKIVPKAMRTKMFQNEQKYPEAEKERDS